MRIKGAPREVFGGGASVGLTPVLHAAEILDNINEIERHDSVIKLDISDTFLAHNCDVEADAAVDELPVTEIYDTRSGRAVCIPSRHRD